MPEQSPRDSARSPVSKIATFSSKLAATSVKLPIYIYRYGLASIAGGRCRHMPSCSEYALDAINRNGAWRGLWLTVSRILRCRPGGTSGFDPAPDIRNEHHPIWACWRYGRWRASDLPDLEPLDGNDSSHVR